MAPSRHGECLEGWGRPRLCLRPSFETRARRSRALLRMRPGVCCGNGPPLTGRRHASVSTPLVASNCTWKLLPLVIEIVVP